MIAAVSMAMVSALIGWRHGWPVSAGVVGTDSHGHMDLPTKAFTPEWLTHG
jgi:hypothetical protein